MPTELRDYQVRTLDAVRAEYRKGSRRVLAVSPTGSGKTRIGSEAAIRHSSKGPTLWTAHRSELVKQAADRLRAEGFASVGIIAPWAQYDPGALIQVASVQTLRARGLYPDASLVVLDEAHHYASDDWRELAFHYERTHVLGLTATPERSDGKPLGDIFEALVSVVQVAELTQRGFLVPCEVHAPKRRLRREIAGNPVDRYLEVARGRRAIFFAEKVERAEELAASLEEKGIPAACIHADTPTDDRAEALERFSRGELIALTNVYVLTEGTDLPPAEVCVLARGFGHASTYLQCVGRVLRPSPETGKTSALVLDLCGVSRRFGLPSDEREYSLEGKAIRIVDRVEREMLATGDAQMLREIEAELEAVREINVTLAKYTRGRTWTPEAQALREMLKEAQQRGRKLGSAVHQFVRQFGHLPWEAR